MYPLNAMLMGLPALGVGEIALILILFTLLFGGKKFAELGKGLGDGILGFKRAIREGKEAEKVVKKEGDDLAAEIKS